MDAHLVTTLGWHAGAADIGRGWRRPVQGEVSQAQGWDQHNSIVAICVSYCCQYVIMLILFTVNVLCSLPGAGAVFLSRADHPTASPGARLGSLANGHAWIDSNAHRRTNQHSGKG